MAIATPVGAGERVNGPVSVRRVSVVVPVRDRRDLLAELLDALEVQTFRDFEVVVVDDGSSDDSAAVAARHVAGRPVVVVDGGGRGAVHARTLGVARAGGPILAFTDSDCVPAPTWLQAGVEAIEAGADVANGRTRPARPMRPLERSMGSGLEGLYPTCNVFYRRAAFDCAGGFDGSAGRRLGFRFDRRSKGDGLGEDTLLAWRVVRAGTAAFVPEAIVEHHVFPPDYWDTLSRTARTAAFPGLVREVPELRRTLLTRRVQLGARSRLPVYGLLGVLLGARRRRMPLAVGGLMWWAAVRFGELRRSGEPTARCVALLPLEMALDVLTAGALLVGSVRARSLVL